MGFYRGPHIVTDGLVLALDAANRQSYVSGSTIWNDLSGNGNHVTLYNTPVYFDGALSGNGISSYGRTTNTLNLSGLSSITVISIWKQTTSTTGGMVYEHTANWNNNNNYSGVSYGGFGLSSNSNGTVTSENLNHHQLRGNVGYSGQNVMSPNTSNFQQYTTIHDFTGGTNLETKVYINGNFVNGSSAGGGNNTSTFGDDYLYLWSRGGVSIFSPNSLSLIMIYNRILTDSEIQQNYNATRGRFGL
jgi:hypothetical protein